MSYPTAHQACLNGAFGEVIVDLDHPYVSHLKLRQQDGILGVKSLLNTADTGAQLAVDWGLFGPFAGHSAADVERPYLREEALLDPRNPALRSDGSACYPIPYRIKGEECSVNFAEGLNTAAMFPDKVAYAVAIFQWPTVETIALTIEMDWLGVVWVNGQEVLRLTNEARAIRETKKVGQPLIVGNVPARQGENRIVIKCMSGSSGFFVKPTIRGGERLRAANGIPVNLGRVGAYSYVEDLDGNLFQSHYSRGHVATEISDRRIAIRNIRLQKYPGYGMSDGWPVEEDWVLSVTAEGDLRWAITQRWRTCTHVRKMALPGLFFNVRANAEPTPGIAYNHTNPEANAVAALLWVDPRQWRASDRYNELNPFQFCNRYSSETRNHAVYQQRNGWVRAKLYTSFPNDQDLYLEADNGHVFRRGRYSSHNELGLLPDLDNVREFKAGTTLTVALKIGARPGLQSGLNLHCELPDKSMERDLSTYSSSLVNVAPWASPVDYTIGNQVEGVYYTGDILFSSVALLAGIESPTPLSGHPFGATQGICRSLDKIFSEVDEHGQVFVGFNRAVATEIDAVVVEEPYMTVVAAECYFLATADRSFLARHLSAIHRRMAACDAYLKEDLLSLGEGAPEPLMYLDSLKFSGAVAGSNAWYIRGLEAYALLLEAVGELVLAETVRRKRERAIRAFNQVFWNENAYGPGQAGYYDCIEPNGRKHAYFYANVQYPAIVFGIASPEQAARLLRTADQRQAQLTTQYGYSGEFTLDNLWPVDDALIRGGEQKVWPPTGTSFGGYMNGGSMPCMTYYEVLARARAGDVEGAYDRLRRFSARAGRTNLFEGDTSFDMRGKLFGYNSEPYLADQLMVAAALVHGLLGIRQTLDGVTVSGRLPSRWPQATAVVPWMGRQVEVVRANDAATATIREVEPH
ncbi:MAG: hypothetical protein PHR35_03355 [Kiritimatiellae bacterium]|nr:hypothetical protein [Kiritimatiellia bacterium]